MFNIFNMEELMLLPETLIFYSCFSFFHGNDATLPTCSMSVFYTAVTYSMFCCFLSLWALDSGSAKYCGILKFSNSLSDWTFIMEPSWAQTQASREE